MKPYPFRRGRLTVAVFDFLFILTALSLLVLFFAFARPRTAAGADTSLQYTLRFSLVCEEYVTDIHIGDTVIDAVGKRMLGRVTDFSVTPATTEVYDRTSGRMRESVYPHRVTLTLTVETEAKRLEEGWSVAGLTLLRRARLPVRLPNFVGTGIFVECRETAITPKSNLKFI